MKFGHLIDRGETAMAERNEQDPTGRADELEFPAEERAKRQREFDHVEENRRAANSEPNQKAVHSKVADQIPEFKDAETVVEERQNDPRDRAQGADNPAAGSPTSDERQLSSKTGKRSSAQKMDSARNETAPIPAANPVAGAFGRDRQKH
jgi:hypothetical protein